jgi:hypothetical protein
MQKMVPWVKITPPCPEDVQPKHGGKTDLFSIFSRCLKTQQKIQNHTNNWKALPYTRI